MRAVCWGSLGACLLVLGGAPAADDRADARAVVEKAVKAMGGAEKVARFAAATVKFKVTHEQDGRQEMLVGSGAWQGLDKVRIEGELGAGGEGRKLLVIINGDAGWEKKGDQGRDTPEGLVPALKSAFYALRMPHLLPGLKDQAFTLATRGGQPVEGKDAVALSVNHKDRPEVTVLFDKETGLPVKSQTRITGPDGREITVEFFYSDYREVNGVKHPMKIVLKADGNEFTIELSEILQKDQVDESEFAKP
jgi:hypothetical protein